MIFISYRRKDAAAVDALASALDALSVKTWIDRAEIHDADAIQARIDDGLAQCTALLAWYSADYPGSRACQWELTSALIVERGAPTSPARRILVVNPEPGSDHIQPLEVRNLHYFAAPTDSNYNALAGRIAAAIAPLNGSFGALRRLTRPRCHGYHPLGSRRFVGRIGDIWNLHNALARGDFAIVSGAVSPAAAGQVAQVHGSGGIGKSLLAEEYALRFGAFWSGGLFWLRAFGNSDDPAESADSLAQRRAQEHSIQLANIGLALEIDPRGLEDPILRTLIGLRLDKLGQPYLWVVDDLPDCNRGELDAWLAPGALGQTLITTRSRRQDGIGWSLQLDILPPADARALLTRDHAPRPEEGATVDAILGLLDGHALALDIARAACIRHGYLGFLERLQNPDRDALEFAAELAPELPNGHNPSIAVTFLAGFDELPEPARDFLRLAAQLAVAPIEPVLVGACFIQADGLGEVDAQDMADRGIQQAIDRSFAEPREPGVHGHLPYVHGLISRSLRFRDRMPERQSTLRAAAVAALNSALSQGNDIRRHAALEHAVSHATQLAREGANSEELRLAAHLGRYHYEAARYASARQWLEAASEGLRAKLGENHSDTLSALNDLSLTLQAQGDLGGARILQESALATRRRVLGDEHPATLTSMNNLASTLQAQGDLAGARELQESALATRRRLLGEEHPDTLGSIINLASTLQAQGDLAGARELQESALAISCRVLGEEHPATLASINNLASTLSAQGDLVGARALEESVLATQRRLLGEKHPNTLTSMSNLALTLQTQCDLTGARALQESALATQRRLLGDEHPATLTTMNNLAGTLKAQGDLVGALALQESALAARRRVLGADHPDTLNCAAWLADSLWNSGDRLPAVALMRATADGLKRALGAEHEKTRAVRDAAEDMQAAIDRARKQGQLPPKF